MRAAGLIPATGFGRKLDEPAKDAGHWRHQKLYIKSKSVAQIFMKAAGQADERGEREGSKILFPGICGKHEQSCRRASRL